MKKYYVLGVHDVPAGLPVINESSKVVGVTNTDGSISITDSDFIKAMNLIENQVVSISFKEEKDNDKRNTKKNYRIVGRKEK